MLLILLSMSTVAVLLLSFPWSQVLTRKKKKEKSTKVLFTYKEALAAFDQNSWQRQSLDDFVSRITFDEDVKFPCIYATKGFLGNEQRYCFGDGYDHQSLSATSLDDLAHALELYTNSSADTPMTSLVCLLRRAPKSLGLDHYRSSYWNILRAIAVRDKLPWPRDVPKNVDDLAWMYCFNGMQLVSLAMTPTYQKRQSRWCPSFVIVIQPLSIFMKLLSTAQKTERVTQTVRSLCDEMDGVAYCPDVIENTAGRSPIHKMFFIGDNNNTSLSCPWTQIKD